MAWAQGNFNSLRRVYGRAQFRPNRGSKHWRHAAVAILALLRHKRPDGDAVTDAGVAQW
jgi:hypothetical protein